MIRLQIHFEVADTNRETFERMYHLVYLPALLRQEGFLGSHLLHTYPAAMRDEIGAAGLPYNYQLELDFDTEDNRRRWASSPEHDELWPAALALAKSSQFSAYDIVAADAKPSDGSEQGG